MLRWDAHLSPEMHVVLGRQIDSAASGASLDRLITQCGTYYCAAPEIFVCRGFRDKRKCRYAINAVDRKETGATLGEYGEWV